MNYNVYRAWRDMLTSYKDRHSFVADITYQHMASAANEELDGTRDTVVTYSALGLLCVCYQVVHTPKNIEPLRALESMFDRVTEIPGVIRTYNLRVPTPGGVPDEVAEWAQFKTRPPILLGHTLHYWSSEYQLPFINIAKMLDVHWRNL